MYGHLTEETGLHNRVRTVYWFLYFRLQLYVLPLRLRQTLIIFFLVIIFSCNSSIRLRFSVSVIPGWNVLKQPHSCQHIHMHTSDNDLLHM